MILYNLCLLFQYTVGNVKFFQRYEIWHRENWWMDQKYEIELLFSIHGWFLNVWDVYVIVLKGGWVGINKEEVVIIRVANELVLYHPMANKMLENVLIAYGHVGVNKGSKRCGTNVWNLDACEIWIWLLLLPVCYIYMFKLDVDFISLCRVECFSHWV